MSGLGGHIATSTFWSLSESFEDALFELVWFKTQDFQLEFRRYVS